MTVTFPYKLPATMDATAIDAVRTGADEVAARSQYGWGHTIDFGAFVKEGFLADAYLKIAGFLEERDWLPQSFVGMHAADVGCFTGGLTMLIASRGAAQVYAVDEVPAHLDQARFVGETFNVPNVTYVQESVYRLDQHIAPGSLDYILLSGVLYHLSDMLVGLYMMRQLLKPGGTLIIETNGVNDMEQSYANFGRFAGGMWWQPSGLCITDMCQFMGFEGTDLFFYYDNRCLVRTTRSDANEITFKRGMNWPFEDLRDGARREFGLRTMAPVKK